MKKILLIFTGGTIMCKTENGIMSIDENMGAYLVDAYKKTSGDDSTEFEMMTPFVMLSENMSLALWNRLVKMLAGVDFEKYEGVIITHGSDTLAYTSALVGMLYRHTKVPLIITAANKPVNEKGSNGLFNFRSAVKLIKEKRYPGVFTVYEQVYLSTRLIPADTYLDRFSSYGGEPFEGVSENRLKKPRERLIDPDITLEKSITVVNPYPGFDYTSVNLSSRPAAVLHTLYHSGTACTDGEGKNSLISFIDKCKALDIPLYLCGTKGRGAGIYESASRYIDKGVSTIDRISDVAAYVKLLIAYNQKEINPARYIYSNVFFEML